MMSNLPVVKGEESHAADQMIQLVSFELAGEEYGIDVLSVREIIRMPTITKMPNVQDFVDGIINLRGTVVPIISLRKRFGLQEREEDRNSRILVMELAGGLTGFVVDAVAEVIRISCSEIKPAPGMVQGNSQDYVTGVLNRAERLLIVLDLERQLTAEEKQAMQALE
jgi:purine-binding chemotaxis protein CheW